MLTVSPSTEVSVGVLYGTDWDFLFYDSPVIFNKNRGVVLNRLSRDMVHIYLPKSSLKSIRSNSDVQMSLAGWYVGTTFLTQNRHKRF
ncbi:MAG: hypothetical protein AAB909_01850, partial [Patescibacteria group bacterium]